MIAHTVGDGRRSGPLDTTGKKPAEKPKPANGGCTPSSSLPVTIGVPNSAPIVMDARAITLGPGARQRDRTT